MTWRPTIEVDRQAGERASMVFTDTLDFYPWLSGNDCRTHCGREGT